MLEGTAPPDIRRSVAQDLEYGKVLCDLAHPLFGQIPPIKRLKSRRFLDCIEEIVTAPQTERFKKWKSQEKHLHNWIEPLEEVPEGVEEEWTATYTNSRKLN